jgi:tetratricopeptide (TPR) repeat protein
MEKRSLIYKIKTSVAMCAVAVMLLGCRGGAALVEKGIANLELGDYKRARACFEALVDQSPSNRAARLGLGKALLQEFSANPADSSLLSDCLTNLSAARSLQPDQEVETLLSVVWFKHAEMLLHRNDTLEAIAALTRSIGFDPAAGKPLNLAGILYYHRGEPEKALNLFTMVMNVDSASISGFFNAGMIYWTQGKYDRAYDLWYKAAQKSPHDKEIIAWAAQAKVRMAGAAK